MAVVRVTLVLLSCWVIASEASNPIVKVETGLLKGKYAINGSAEFLAIPFAAPPVGNLRWQSPQPALAWSGERDATDWGAPCMQPPQSYFKTPSEDCLFLNVFVPPGVNFRCRVPADMDDVLHSHTHSCISNPTPNRTVMMFIYGGSYIDGAASIPIYDGSFTEGLHHDVVLVTTNYRVGLLGFAGSELIRQHNSVDNTTGNFGLQDQRAAMKWIHRNVSHAGCQPSTGHRAQPPYEQLLMLQIAAFGGNASRLMVWGESAGAGSTSAHLVAPRRCV